MSGLSPLSGGRNRRHGPFGGRHRARAAFRDTGPGHGATIAAALVALPWVAWAVVRTFGLERGVPGVPAMAFTPYVALTSVLPLAVALLLRRRAVAAVTAAAAVALGAAVVPRMLPGPRPEVRDGRTLTVMTANLHLGDADAATIVRLVREERVDVLSLQEMTPQVVRRLDAAGLRRELPYRVARPRPGAAGSGLFTRRRVASTIDIPGPNEPPGGRIRLPGVGPVELHAIHPWTPTTRHNLPGWRKQLQAIPPPSKGPELRLLLGDFNATLDHHELRKVLDEGYRDAADATGAGLRMTWPAGRHFPPELAIDHVLVDRRVRPEWVRVRLVPHSDHRALIARLTLPQNARPAS
ncbi:MAG: endonuclease/exonuclease/phosphatase family protein [Solirubrobacterales bacterium]|nr:endonuclease/exonuclease/phosphatase family protein [Solirubrobacterales bacterium]